MSHPSRVRGLKYTPRSSHGQATKVAPLAGAWIEISNGGKSTDPFARSHPSRVRGLK